MMLASPDLHLGPQPQMTFPKWEGHLVFSGEKWVHYYQDSFIFHPSLSGEGPGERPLRDVGKLHHINRHYAS